MNDNFRVGFEKTASVWSEGAKAGWKATKKFVGKWSGADDISKGVKGMNKIVKNRGAAGSKLSKATKARAGMRGVQITKGVGKVTGIAGATYAAS